MKMIIVMIMMIMKILNAVLNDHCVQSGLIHIALRLLSFIISNANKVITIIADSVRTSA